MGLNRGKKTQPEGWWHHSWVRVADRVERMGGEMMAPIDMPPWTEEGHKGSALHGELRNYTGN